MSLDKWLKRLWLVNGIILLVLMVVLLGMLVLEQRNRQRDFATAPVELVDSSGPAAPRTPRALRYDHPVSVWGTTTQLARIKYGEGYLAEEFGAGLESSGIPRNQPMVNVLFLHDDGSAELLLERPAFIRQIRAPTSRRDSLQTWISYEIATEDTDGDGRLDSDDLTQVYDTDLDGRGLRSVLAVPMRVTWHGPFNRPHRILILALDAAPADGDVEDHELPQRAFVYDVASGLTTPHEVVNELMIRAGQLLAN